MDRYQLGSDGLPVLDEEGNKILVVKPPKKKSSGGSSHKAKKPEDGSAAAGGDSLPSVSSKGSGHKGGSSSGKGSGGSSKGKSGSKSGDSAVQSGGISKKGGGAVSKSNQSPGGTPKAAAVGTAPKSKKKKHVHGSVDGAAAPKTAAASSAPPSKKKKKKKAEDAAPVLEFSDDDALYTDAGMIQLCDGSVFFGVLPQEKGSRSGGGDVRGGGDVKGGGDVRGVEVASIKTESAIAAPRNDFAADVVADMSAHGGEKLHMEARNCNELEVCETALLDGPSRSNACLNNDAYGIDDHVHVSGGASSVEDSANEMRDGNVAAATEGGGAIVAQPAVADQLASEMEDGHNHNSEDQNTVLSGDKSEPSSTPACHPSPRLLRPTRAPSSSHTSTAAAPCSKFNRLHSDSPNTSQKPVPEQDSVFIRSATAPPIECFNPVFHFQR